MKIEEQNKIELDILAKKRLGENFYIRLTMGKNPNITEYELWNIHADGTRGSYGACSKSAMKRYIEDIRQRLIGEHIGEMINTIFDKL